MSNVSVDMLSLNALVSLRLGMHEIEHPSRIEDVAADTVTVAAPPGSTAALLASGLRDVEVGWISPRGRYEQRCQIVEHISGHPKLWRLRPVGRAILVQRRRYVRVRAAVAVLIFVGTDAVPATTIDISEGGFRVRMPYREIPELAHAKIHATLGGGPIEVSGYVVRATKTEFGETEAVIAFEAEGAESDAIRRFVFQWQLRTRAAQQA